MAGQGALLAGYGCAPIALFDRVACGRTHVRGRRWPSSAAAIAPTTWSGSSTTDRPAIVANSDRTLMRIRAADLARRPPSPGRNRMYESSGMPYVSIAQVGVVQLDDLNGGFAAGIQRNIATGALNLVSFPKRGL